MGQKAQELPSEDPAVVGDDRLQAIVVGVGEHPQPISSYQLRQYLGRAGKRYSAAQDLRAPPRCQPVVGAHPQGLECPTERLAHTSS